jgi:hypothetical protein
MKTQSNLQVLIAKEVKRELQKAPNTIREMIRGSLLSLLGLERRGSDIEIDHCNGRNSVLIDAFRNTAIKEAEKISASYQPTEKDVAGFRAAFEREYNRQMHYQLSNMAGERVKKDVALYLDSIKIDVATEFARQMASESNKPTA